MEIKKFNIKDHRIASLIITISLMFLIFHLLTGTKSISEKNDIQKKINEPKVIIKYEQIDPDEIIE